MEQIKKTYESFEQFCQLQTQWIQKEHEEEVKFIQQITNSLTHMQMIQIGYAMGKLKLIKMKMTFGNRQILVFETEQQQQQQIDQNQENDKETLRLKQGDQVGIYLWSKVLKQQKFCHPDAIGVIDRYRKHLRIILDQNSQFSDEPLIYAIALQENFITYKRHMQAIEEMKKNYEKHPILKALFSDDEQFKQSKNIKEEFQLQGESSKKLNEQQIVAVQNAMNQKYIALIHGPPGTGKTRTICEYIKQAVTIQKKKILACANSNIAVDNMIERILNISNLKICRIGNPARMTDQVKYVCIDALVKKTSSYGLMKQIKIEIQQIEKQINRADRKDWNLRDKLKQKKKEYSEQEQLAYEEAIQDCSVIFSTNVGSGQYQFQQLTKNIIFDIVVIDECAQSLEISCWIPIMKGNKIVLAGDHCQLPPTVKSKGTGLELTLFERIENEQRNINTLLTKQYRMNKQIMNWSSQEFYDGHLLADESVADQKIQESVLMLIDTSFCEMYEQEQENIIFDDQNKSKYNIGEVNLVQEIVKELIQLDIKSQDIGIITPYNAQVQMLKKKIENVEISTVDGFQGREKECIIISMVRSNKQNEVGFLSETRRMNVAVTRAKKFVCLIGDSETVSSNEFLKRLINYFSENGEVRSAQEYINNDQIKVPCNQQQKQKIDNQEKNNKKKNKKHPKEQNQQNIIQDKNDLDEKKIQEINNLEKEVIAFIESDKIEILFKNQTGFQRKTLHELAEKYELNHESLGNDKLKNLILRKKKIDFIEQPQDQFKETEVKEQQIKSEQLQQLQQVDEKDNQIQISEIQQEIKQQQIKEQPKQQQQQKKKKNNNNNNKIKKTKEQQQQDEDDFFNSISLLDPKKCSYMINNLQCQSSLNLLSLTCKFCQKIFCSKHQLAEEHGCGEAASQAARSQFLNDRYKHEENSRLIQEKLKQAQEQRKPKQKKK